MALIAAIRELDQDFGEDTGAGGRMLGARFLLLAVTDAVAARNEDHAGGTPPRHEFRVMRGARDDVHVRKAESKRGSSDRRDDRGAERRRLRAYRLHDPDLAAFSIGAADGL